MVLEEGLYLGLGNLRLVEVEPGSEDGWIESGIGRVCGRRLVGGWLVGAGGELRVVC